MKSKLLMLLFLICLLPLSFVSGQYLKRDEGRRISVVPSVKVSPSQETYDSLGAVREDIDSLESAVDSIDENVSDNVARLDSLSGVAPDTTEFKAEQANIDNLETAVDSMNPNISDNASAISTNATDITNLETAVDTMNPNISDNASNISTNTSDIAALPTFAETGSLVGDSLTKTADRALETDNGGKIVASAITKIELNYLDDVTSGIQDQLNGKSPTAGNSGLNTTGTVTTGTWSANVGEMILINALAGDHTASGKVTTVQVDINGQGIGAPLTMKADGNYETCDASSASTMVCQVIAMEIGAGTKKVCHYGYMRDNTWNWTSLGQPIYVSATTGTLTQTPPAVPGDQVQFVGYAVTADIMFVNPNAIAIERP